MMADQDPPRLRTLRAELPRDLERALEATKDDGPTPDALALLGRSLSHAIEAANERPSRVVPRRRPPRTRIAVLVSTFALGAGAGVLVSGGVYLASRPSEEAPVATPSVAPAASARVAPRHVAPPREAAPPLESAPPPTPPPHHEPHPAQNPGVDLPAGDVAAADAGDRAELELIARAQAALGRDPGLALALASDHERKFPGGALAQEREVVAIDALLRLGRRAQAESRSLRFRQQFPTSVHGRRIDVLLNGALQATPDHN